MIDESKLPPAPWRSVSGLKFPLDGAGQCVDPNDIKEFAALARNFLDVCERRGWGALPENGSWWVFDDDSAFLGPFDSALAAWEAAVKYDRENPA